MLACLSCGSLSLAQQAPAGLKDLSKNPEWFPRFYRPYQSRTLPGPNLSNSPLVGRLLTEGKLVLSLADLKAAVRENNLDIASAGYVAAYAETDLLRAKGGGAPRGGAGISIPSGLFAGAIGAGLGGSAGVGGFGSAGGISGGARAVVVRPSGSLDPSFILNFSQDHNTSPLNTVRVSGIPIVTSDTTTVQARYVQAFTSGTNISISFNNQRQESTQLNLRFNPSVVSTFSLQFSQQLLNGFGRAANRRFLDIAENDRRMAQESIRQQVSTILAQAENAYWDLVAARENVRLAEKSLAVSQQLQEENQAREEVGKMSQLDVVTAESEVASRRRDLVVARTNLQMRELDLKNVLSKQTDAALAQAAVETVDPLPEPRPGDIPELKEALTLAQKDRPEIRLDEENILNQAIAVKYASNLLKPTLTVFGVLGSSGLWGERYLPVLPNPTPVPFSGGWSQALRQVRSFSYPEYAFGFSFSVPLHNSSARADSARARLEQREAETELQQTRNQVSLEVRNAVMSLNQARVQVETSHTAAVLSAQTVDAEAERLRNGVSTSYNLILKQRDLLAAQLAEVQARVNYAKALVELSRATGALDK